MHLLETKNNKHPEKLGTCQHCAISTATDVEKEK